jgi:hypothetical protein
MRGRARMTMQGIVEGGTPTRHSLRVEWFQRDPGGSTIFILPAEGGGTVSQSATDQDEERGPAPH